MRVPGLVADHYEVLDRLGEGGMGVVHRARDLRLERFVALKFLKSDDPALERRFLQEAQAQARVLHPHVCGVFEVGREGDLSFIALQLVNGQTLTDAASAMTLEWKIRVLRDVAEGVAAAHRVALVHRDIKPSNILVERTADGGFYAWVTDFGLARDLGQPGATVTGAIVGTPQYMAPEQARGDEKLDRRVDVYALGATLYELLAGAPPFTGATALQILMRSQHEEPRSLKSLGDAPPRDLQLVVQKSMEKSPARRYDSARALADDLQRWLDGEPVLASAPSLASRLRRTGRRNPAAAATAGALALSLVVGGAVWLRDRARSAQRVRIAQELDDEVRDLEQSLRMSALLALHDTTPERTRARARIARISALAARRDTRGQVQAALGRALLLLGQPVAARTALAQAWELGERSPVTGRALGMAYGESYRLAREAAQGLAGAQLRQSALRTAERTLRDPAVRHLKNSGAEGAYGRALLAFYDRRFDEALREAQAARADEPWLVDVLTLQGDIETARGDELRDAGDEGAATAAYARAELAYRSATAEGRSDLRAFEGLCRLHAAEVRMKVWGKGGDPAQAAAAARAACETAARIAPDRAGPHVLLASLSRMLADRLHRLSQPADAEIAQGEAEGARAVALAPDDPAAHGALGAVRRARCLLLVERRDPARDEACGGAIEELERAVSLDPVPTQWLSSLALVLTDLGEAESDARRDPGPYLRRATEALDRALRLDGLDAALHTNLGRIHYFEASWAGAHGQPAEPLWDACIAEFTQSFALSPSTIEAENVAVAWNARASSQREAGIDPAPALQKAVDAAEQALRMDRVAATLAVVVDTSLDAAVAARQAGRDPAQHLARARAALDELLATGARQAAWESLAGGVAVEEARLALARGQSVENRLTLAREHLREALRLQPDRGSALDRTVAAAVVEARALQRDGRAAGAPLRRALAALAPRPGEPLEAPRGRAELQLWLLELGVGSAAELAAGLRDARAAQRLSPSDARAQLVLAALLQRNREPEGDALWAAAARRAPLSVTDFARKPAAAATAAR